MNYVASKNPTTRSLSHHRTYTRVVYKLCMLTPTKLAADFSRGCVLQVIARGFLVTHPHRALPREVALNDTPWLPYRFAFRQNRGYGVRRTEEIQMGGIFLVSIDLSSDAEDLLS
jgi:hypothetical protein